MFDPTEYIKKAKMVDGGHLSIGRGGYDIENIKALCIEAGLPVIDSRCVPFDLVADLAVCGPMAAVGTAPRFFMSRAFSHVSLAEWVASYRASGAEIHNMPEVSDEPAS